MLVPVMDTKSGLTLSQLLLVDEIKVPGAVKSGFLRPPTVGPLLLEFLIISSERLVVPMSCIFATQMIFAAIAGSPTVIDPGPSLPALMVAGMNKSATTASQKRAGSV